MDELGNGDWSIVLWIGLVLHTGVGAVVGPVIALISSFVIDRFALDDDDFEAVRGVFYTTGGSLIGLLISLLLSTSIIYCIDTPETCAVLLPFELGKLSIKAVGVFPSLGAIAGGIAY